MKQKIIKCVVFLLVAILLLCGGFLLYRHMTKKHEKTAAEYISEAQAMLDVEKYEKAEDICTEGLKQYSDSYELYIIKIQSYGLRQDYDMALRTLEYGYKQTGNENILYLLEEYTPYLDYEEDVSYLPISNNAHAAAPQENISDWSSDEEKEYTKDKGINYIITDIPDVAIPVVTMPETTVTEPEAVQPDEALPEENAAEEMLP